MAMRSHYCGLVTEALMGQTVTLSGWVNRRRDHGGVIFIDLRDEFVSVYVPTTPNPTGGYFVMVRKSDCVELDMSVDSALKYIVSMGVVAPAAPTQLPLK